MEKERKTERKNLFGIFLCFTAIADSLFLRYVICLNSFISSVIFSKMFVSIVLIWYTYVENQTQKCVLVHVLLGADLMFCNWTTCAVYIVIHELWTLL
jgi:hypothetical protein